MYNFWIYLNIYFIIIIWICKKFITVIFICFSNIFSLEVLYLEEKNYNTKEKYECEINDKQEKILKKIDLNRNKKISIIFENEEETNIMINVLKELSNCYIEDFFKEINL